MYHRGPQAHRLILCCLAALVARPTLAQISSGDRPAYRSPIDVAYSPDGSLLAVADRTWPGLVLIKPGDGSVVREVKLLGDPYHVAWYGDDKVLVAEGGNGTVAEIEASSGNVLRHIPVGAVAKGLAVTPDGRLLVCDRARNKLLVLKLATGELDFAVDVGREPGTVAVTKDGKYAVVGNKLPRPDNPLTGTPSAEVSIVDLTTKQVRHVHLVKQATMVRHVVVSPDGKWAYVTHQSPRGGLPVTQLDNGWVMTNALSIIDVAAASLYSNFVFDRSGSGGAVPWGATVNADGTRLWATLAGVGEVASVDLGALHKRLAGYSAAQRADLILNLSDLHTDGTIKRTPLAGVEGTRGIALSTDGKTLAVAAYFAGKVLLISPSDASVIKTITLPNNPAEDEIRTGERFYYSALNCYQKWLACSSCHDEGHPDGLNWDLINDGTGNPKQTKSHIYSSETPPTNISGCRESALVSSRAGYQFIEFQVAPEDRVQATYAFMKSLVPEPSPFLGADGKLTPDAIEGKKLFEGQAECSGCHKGQYFTDTQKHDVGTRRFGADGPDNNAIWDTAGYDTPTLIEVWRNPPYLHLGSSMTIKDVLTTENKNRNTHGNVAQLSDQQIDQLVAYVMQIGPTRTSPFPVPITPGGSGGTGGTAAGGSSGGHGGTEAGGSSGGTTGQEREGGSGAGGSAGGTTVGPESSSGCICSLRARQSSRGQLPFALATVALLGLWAVRRPRRRGLLRRLLPVVEDAQTLDPFGAGADSAHGAHQAQGHPRLGVLAARGVLLVHGEVEQEHGVRALAHEHDHACEGGWGARLVEREQALDLAKAPQVEAQGAGLFRDAGNPVAMD
jgi:DNA-binding beta-propeller fold protein YncE